MARTRRIKFTDRDALHHVTSRVSGRQMLLAGAGVKGDMLDALDALLGPGHFRFKADPYDADKARSAAAWRASHAPEAAPKA